MSGEISHYKVEREISKLKESGKPLQIEMGNLSLDSSPHFCELLFQKIVKNLYETQGKMFRGPYVSHGTG